MQRNKPPADENCWREREKWNVYRKVKTESALKEMRQDEIKFISRGIKQTTKK